MNRQRFALCLLLPTLLSACAVIDRRATPAPVEDLGAPQPRVAVPQPVPAAIPAPAPAARPALPQSGARASVGAPPAPQVAAESSIAITPYQPAETLALATPPQPIAPRRPPPVAPAPRLKPEYSPAGEALVEAADQAQAGGDLDYAAVAVERALRIEPRNPWLWNRLAQLRLSQSRYAEAAELAAKSNALAGDKPTLKRANWQLTAQAKRARGDITGARVAEQQAARLAR